MNKADRDKRSRQSRFARTAANGGIAPVAVHNASVYGNWGCRCKICLDDVGRLRGRKRVIKAPTRKYLTEKEQRVLLDRFRIKLRRLANSLVWNDVDMIDYVDELAQEGWIAIWRTVTDKGVLPDGILMAHARNNMLKRIRFDRQQCRDVRCTIPISEFEWEGDISDLFGAIDVDLTEVEDAYHDGRILDAVNKLPAQQKAYVIRRFWHGWTAKPLEVYFDKNPNDIWRYAKKNLERELLSAGVMNSD